MKSKKKGYLSNVETTFPLLSTEMKHVLNYVNQKEQRKLAAAKKEKM